MEYFAAVGNDAAEDQDGRKGKHETHFCQTQCKRNNKKREVRRDIILLQIKYKDEILYVEAKKG